MKDKWKIIVVSFIRGITALTMINKDSRGCLRFYLREIQDIRLYCAHDRGHCSSVTSPLEASFDVTSSSILAGLEVPWQSVGTSLPPHVSTAVKSFCRLKSKRNGHESIALISIRFLSFSSERIDIVIELINGPFI